MIMDSNDNIPEFWSNDDAERVPKEPLDDMEAKEEDWDKWLEGIRRPLSTGNLGSHGVKERGIGLGEWLGGIEWKNLVLPTTTTTAADDRVNLLSKEKLEMKSAMLQLNDSYRHGKNIVDSFLCWRPRAISELRKPGDPWGDRWQAPATIVTSRPKAKSTSAFWMARSAKDGIQTTSSHSS